MMRYFVFMLLLMLQAVVNAQTSNTPIPEDLQVIHPGGDSTFESSRALYALRQLKNGTLVVRLKTNQKSIDAYRRAGQNNIAERIEEDWNKRNSKIMKAFKDELFYCKVLFIHSHDTKRLLEGETGLFLNDNLERDSKIVLEDSFYLFCDYGSANTYAGYHKTEDGSYYYNSPEKILDTIPTGKSSSVASTSSLVVLDTNLEQFYSPFPYAVPVYLENFGAAVRSLNRALEGTYQRRIINRDMRQQEKLQRKLDRQN